MIHITHTHAEGTLIVGTTRDDAPTIKSAGMGWRWSSNLGSWYLPHSRDKVANRWKIDRTADKLRESGADVVVEIDNEARDMAEVHAARIERADDRETALAAKAERIGAEAAAKLDQVAKLRDLIPMGQPMLRDHYSYNRDRNFRDKLHRMEGKGHELAAEAKSAASRAAAVTDHDARLTDRGYLGRKIKTLTADANKYRRTLAGRDEPTFNDDGKLTGWHKVMPDEQYAADTRARLDQTEAELKFYGDALAALDTADRENGTALPSKDTVRPGDIVKARGDIVRVVKANAKTVKVRHERIGMELSYPWTEIELIPSAFAPVAAE